MGKLGWKSTQDTEINGTIRLRESLDDIFRASKSRCSPWISQWRELIFFQKPLWVRFLLHAIERVLIKSLRKLSFWCFITSPHKAFLFDICHILPILGTHVILQLKIDNKKYGNIKKLHKFSTFIYNKAWNWLHNF